MDGFPLWQVQADALTHELVVEEWQGTAQQLVEGDQAILHLTLAHEVAQPGDDPLGLAHLGEGQV
ncbi:hypothetical protein D3C77_806340 [compost metagenome]